MNSDILEGKWKQLVASAKQRWGRLTDSDLMLIGGKKDELIGKLQERYGWAREEAARQVDQWTSRSAAEHEAALEYRSTLDQI